MALVPMAGIRFAGGLSPAATRAIDDSTRAHQKSMSTTTPAPNNTTSTSSPPAVSSDTIDPSFEGYEDDYGYRSVSRAAVLCLVFALMGLLSWYSPLLLLLPAVALFFGLIAFGNLKRYPTELSGRPVAVTGILIALLTLAVCPAKHAYIYYTELPEGYERISFAALKSPVGAPDIPPMSAMELDGKMVFVKGYIHPTSLSSNSAKSFILVPDWATCCFGQQPPLTHMIEVKLTGDQFASKSLRRHSLAGKLSVRPYLKPIDGLQGVFYELEADHFQ
ncbi:MAG: hypothetical protein ACK5O8_08700 [Pirellula sp.]